MKKLLIVLLCIPSLSLAAGISRTDCEYPNRDENYIYHMSYDYCYRLIYEEPSLQELRERIEELEDENEDNSDEIEELREQLEEE